MLGILKQLGYFLAATCILVVATVGAVAIFVIATFVKVIVLIGAAIIVVIFCLKAYFESVPSNKAERDS